MVDFLAVNVDEARSVAGIEDAGRPGIRRGSDTPRGRTYCSVILCSFVANSSS